MNFDLDFINKGLPRKVAEIEALKPVDTFLQDVLFGDGEVAGNDKMDGILFDWRKEADIALAEESLRGADATRINYKTGFNADMVVPNYYNHTDSVTIDDADARVFGEEINAESNTQQRVVRVFAEKIAAEKKSITVAKEKMCADAIFNGAVANKAGTQSFPMTNSLLGLSAEGALLYTNPLKAIGDAAEKIRKKNKAFRPTALILNPTNAYGLLAAQEGKSVIKTDELNLLKFGFGEENKGCVLFGRISTAAGVIGIYSYAGVDANGDNYIPTGKAILCGQHIGKMAYGRVKAVGPNGMPSYTVAKERMVTFRKGYGDDATFAFQYQTAPLPLITAIDGFGVLTTIA